jgi:hypothetical protein
MEQNYKVFHVVNIATSKTWKCIGAEDYEQLIRYTTDTAPGGTMLNTVKYSIEGTGLGV